jgi:hypothetical protein
MQAASGCNNNRMRIARFDTDRLFFDTPYVSRHYLQG